MSNETPQNDPLEFMKGMWGNMGFTLPGMVAPTFDVDELEKRIHDLKAVEGWLRMNLSMLQMTIQGLEMQCSTLNAVRAMGQHMATEAPKTENAETDESAAPNESTGQEPFAQAAMWPWNMMQQVQAQMQQHAQELAENEKPAEAKPKKAASAPRKTKK